MKWTILAVLFLAVPAVACDKGCEEHEGVCACEAPMEKAVQTFVPSDEKPSKHPQPAYERENLNVDMGTLATDTTGYPTAHDYTAEREQK